VPVLQCSHCTISTPLLTPVMALSPIGSVSVLSSCSCSSARCEAIMSLKVDHRICNFVLNHSSSWLHFLMEDSTDAVSHKLPRHLSPDTTVSSVSRPKNQQCLRTAHSLLAVLLHSFGIRTQGVNKSLARPGRKRLTGHLQPRRN
jgi:hypothetical protein